MILREDYLNKTRRLQESGLIKVISGIKRSGKSYLINLIINDLKNNGVKDENIILIDLESSKYKNIRNRKDLEEIIYKRTENLKGKVYLFFDEVHNVSGWEITVNAFNVDLDADIYVTSSNSKILSGEFATYLVGRTYRINLYPLRFKELFELKKTKDNENLNKKELFNNYLNYGGMPALQKLPKDDRDTYLTDIFNSLMFDIVEKYEIRDVALLRDLVNYIVNNLGNTFSANSIRKYLKNKNINIGIQTIIKYLSYLEQCLFIQKLEREDIKSKNVFKINEKYYLTDHGFFNIFNGESNIESRLENIVYIELLKRAYDVKVGKINGKEVDFICRKDKKKLYIQVAYLLSNSEIEEREFSPLKEINDNYDKYVVSIDTVDFSQEGIEHYNIIDFLLSDEF